MNNLPFEKNRRILVVDDNRAIHDDFRKILSPVTAAALDASEIALFGKPVNATRKIQYEIDSAYQGQDGVAQVQQALQAGRPYAMAFVDIRMPPGMDGVETTQKIWAVDPEVQIVLCTAYADYSWDEMFEKIGNSDALVILKKPFDTVEALQLAHALTEKWWLHRQSRRKMEELERMVAARTGELQQSNHLLQRQQSELRVLFDFLPAMIVFKDTHNGLLRVNRRMAEIVGKSIEEIEGRPTAEVFPHEADKYYADDLEVIRSGIPRLGIVETVHDREGKVLTIQTDKVPVCDTAGKVSGIIVMSQDITERKRAEEKLQWQAAFLEAQVNSSMDGIIVVNDQGRKILQNQRVADLFKIPPQIVEDEDDGKQVQWVTDMIKNPGQFAEKVRHLYAHPEEVSRDEIELKDGMVLDRYAAPVVGKNGKYYGRIWTFRDITERKRTEDALLRQKTELQVLFDLMPAMIWFKDTENNHLRVNQRVADTAGKTVAEIEGRPTVEIYPEEAAKFYADDLEVIRSGTPKLGIMETLRDRNGKEVWVQTDKVPVRDRDGKIIGIIVMAQDITERKRAEEALRESEQRFSAAFEYAPIGVALVAPDGRWVKVNRALCELVGYSEAELLNRTYEDITHPGDFAACRENVQRLLAGEIRSYQSEKRYVHKNGNFVTVSFNLSLVRDPAGQPLYLIAQIQDITERKRAAEQLVANEALLREFIQHAPAAIAMLDTQMCYIQTSERWIQDYRLAGQKIIGKSHYDIFPDVPQRWKDIHQRVLAGAIEHCEEDPFPRADGLTDWLQWEARPWHQAGGGIGGLIFFTQVITERKRAEAALLESQQRLALAKESAHIGIWDWNVVADHLSWDTRMYELYGIREQDFNGAYDAWQKGLHPEDRARGNEAIHVALDGVRDFHIEFRVVWPNGEVRHIEAQALVQRADDGSPARMIGVNWDITARKQAEESLRLLSSAVEQSKESIMITDATIDLPGPKILFVNPAFVKMSGYTADEVIGQTPRILQGANTDKTVLRRLRQNLERGEPFAGEAINYRKDGKEFNLEWQIAPLRNAGGTITHFVAIQRDITERKQLEARVLQSQKMETVGKLAGGIAHEFNSILTAIIGQSELLLNDLPSGSPLAKSAAEISQAAGRAATLTRQLLAYGRKQFLQPEALDLNQIVVGMQSMFQNLLGSGVEVMIVPAPGLHSVKADAGQIEQVIINMAINAHDAMPVGGKLMLETGNISLDEEYVGCFPESEIKAGEYVMLAITDTGTGMNAEVKARVFEPFFSTKGVGQGTGLGLSTCYGIIKQSGGHISVYSEPGRGTTFKIYLPQVEAQKKIPVQRLDAPGLPRGTETILLVEDDPALRDMATTLLRRLGYIVLAAANGIEALGLKHQPATGHVDLLFTDVVMPHMSGMELANRMRTLYPHTRVLFTSAYTENAIVHQGVLDKGVALLQKPFTPSALANKVREILDQPVALKPDPAQETFGFTKN